MEATPAALSRLGCRLRPLQEGDDAWRRALFAATRPEFTHLPLPDAAREALIAQQFDFQQRHVRAHHPTAASFAIEHGADGPIGCCIVDRQCGEREHRIVDIALLPAWRGRGIGRAWLQACQDDASAQGCDLTLHVAHHNAGARRLYERLGFEAIGDTGAHVCMRWSPPIVS